MNDPIYDPAVKGAAFDATYWAHQPPALRELEVFRLGGGLPPADRLARAAALSQDGYIIDVQIMAMGNDPYTEMFLRLMGPGDSARYLWVPNAHQGNVSLAPGIMFSDANFTGYDATHPPVDAIKVSLDLADYPAWVDPTVPAQPPVIVSWVGSDMGFTKPYQGNDLKAFGQNPAGNQPMLPDGFVYSAPDGHSYVWYAFGNPTPFSGGRRPSVWLQLP